MQDLLVCTCDWLGQTFIRLVILFNFTLQKYTLVNSWSSGLYYMFCSNVCTFDTLNFTLLTTINFTVILGENFKCPNIMENGMLEHRYRNLRKHLDDLGYRQPLVVESLALVERLVSDLLHTTESLRHYKELAQRSFEVWQFIMSKCNFLLLWRLVALISISFICNINIIIR